ncbi:L-proline glycine betaine binding ABC transporter protein ProX [Pantoea sp. AS-PWVM4]|uniref:ABC transporter substrate-binding protein n=1 Tax=Pantoea phytobeneficialis TaxID=2052056 RepID=A0AAP9KS33_9GAMM|nr:MULTISPECIES: ABC transporter substrate-binding protein [Pantoea]ERK16258.1 L-proline glycine betaine binding ABC transporter protein ProX [Pantoea sp. AS-PWVM4]MDO6406597.1 ABC transporter substrate-binding protein [Pantoea phytobeneficialis]QGR09689.1 glycine/betaine ABC transporter substrate-binding protein [Pantoea phytobeneficialis]
MKLSHLFAASLLSLAFCQVTHAAEASETIIIGSADFPESQVLATIYADALAAKNIHVERKMNIGSREVYMPALIDGSVNLMPEYTGAALQYFDKKSQAKTTEQVAGDLVKALPKGITMLTPSQAQDVVTLAVTEKTAEKFKLKDIGDLKTHSQSMTLGGPAEWKTRPEGLPGLKSVYGLEFKSYKTLDVCGPLTLSALVNGQVNVACVFSTDPSIKTRNLVSLNDTQNLNPVQNVVPLISSAKVNSTVTDTLNAISQALTTQDLIAMNARLDNHDDYDVIASDWLKAHKLN